MIGAHQSNPVEFPHLKKCGPIEAGEVAGQDGGMGAVSALEKVRPH